MDIFVSHGRRIHQCEESCISFRPTVIKWIKGVLNEVRSRPQPTPHDADDLSVLREIDELRMQLKLQGDRIKRFEDQLVATGGHAMPNAVRPDGLGPSSRRPSISQDALHAPLSQSRPHPTRPHHSGQPPLMHHHPLLPLSVQQQLPHPTPQHGHVMSPTRPSALGSPAEARSNNTHAAPPLLAVPDLHSRRSVNGAQATPPQAAPLDVAICEKLPRRPNIRPAKRLAPPFLLSGRRSAEPMSHYPPPRQNHYRALLLPGARASGCAAVNTNQLAKRPFDEPQSSPYGCPISGWPKRMKLAPIRSRSMDGEVHPEHALPSLRSACHIAAAAAGPPSLSDHPETYKLSGAHSAPVQAALMGLPIQSGGRCTQVHTYSPNQRQKPLGRGASANHEQDSSGFPGPGPGMGTPHSGTDSYQHSGGFGSMGGSGNKEMRTGRVRNADGMLIRKDGRPDMRSIRFARNAC